MEPNNNDRLKKSAFGGMVWKLSERVCARLVSLAVSIVLARILVPEDYSLVSIVAIFFVFCNVFISGGLNTALIQKKDADALDYSTVLWATLAVALIMYAGMFACAPLIAGLYDKPQLVPVIRVMGLTFFINAFKSVLSAYTSSHLQFRKFFFSTIIGTVISAFIGIIMALRGFGAWALVAQEMSNSLIDTLVLFLTTRLRVRWEFSPKRLRGLFAYGSKNFISSIITVVYDQASPLIVGLRFSAADLAFYTKGKSFPELMNSTLSDTMAAVLFPVMSKVQDNVDDVRGITRRYIKTASYVIFPVMLGLFAVSDSFLLLLLTEKWLPAAVYIQIFCISYMFNLINVGNIQAIRAIGRSDIVLILEVLKKSIYFVVLAAFVFLSGRPQILAVSSIVCTLIAVVINTFPNRKLIGYRYRWQLADILPNLILSACMCIVVVLVGKLPLPPGPLLAVQVLTGVVVYVALSIITKNESFHYLLDFGKQIVKRG
ncbi:MAG: lipopolysaccharide biosynthesis protein [Faecousia sp.]